MACDKQSIQANLASDESPYPSILRFSQNMRLEESGFGNEPVAGQLARHWC